MTILPVQGLQTLDSASAMGPQGKKAKLGHHLTLSMGEPELPRVQFPVDTIFRYTLGLKTILMTMAKVGCYQVLEDDKQTIFAPLSPLLAHLAAAENYALKQSITDTFSQRAILESLIQIDEAIRGEWCKTLREAPFPTLGKAIESHRPFAAAMWLSRPAVTDKGQGKTNTKHNLWPHPPRPKGTATRKETESA